MLRVGGSLWKVDWVIVLVLPALAVDNFQALIRPVLAPQLADADVGQEVWSQVSAVPDQGHECVGDLREHAEVAVRHKSGTTGVTLSWNCFQAIPLSPVGL